MCSFRRLLSSETLSRFSVSATLPTLLKTHAYRYPKAIRRLVYPQNVQIRCLSASSSHESRQKPNPLSSMLPYLHSFQSRAQLVYTRLSTTSYGRLMRLDKPIGNHLLFLPCAWSISLHASLGDMLYLLPLFYTGAILLRGAGCTVNDIFDADVDRMVARTRSRPIASGEVSIPGALTFLSVQLLAGLALASQFNEQTFLMSLILFLPALFYPIAKRRTRYPQAVLGMVFNSGALVGCCAATASISMPAIMLYTSGICWTMVYDTIYAHQDRKDDERLGFGSSAVEFGDKTKPILCGFLAGQMAFLLAAGALADLNTAYYMGITSAMIHSGYQLYQVDLSNDKECLKAFVSNQTTGSLIWLSILCGRIM